MTISPKTLLFVALCSAGSAYAVSQLFSLVSRRFFRDASDAEDDARRKIRKASPVEPRPFTKEELAKFDGRQGPDVYVSVKGVVYEVAPQHYGPGQSYHVFAGKDVSRCLALSIVGDGPANKDWTKGLTAEQQKTLEGWSDMFKGKYPVVGWLVVDSSFNEGI